MSLCFTISLQSMEIAVVIFFPLLIVCFSQDNQKIITTREKYAITWNKITMDLEFNIQLLSLLFCTNLTHFDLTN